MSQHLFTAGTGRDLAGEKSHLIFGGSSLPLADPKYSASKRLGGRYFVAPKAGPTRCLNSAVTVCDAMKSQNKFSDT